MAGHLQTLLEGVVADPAQCLSRLPLSRVEECQQLLVEWNATHTEYPHDQCLHEAFESQVLRTPDAIAIGGADGYLSYSELNRRANQVAHVLRTLDVGAETLVGLCVERSLSDGGRTAGHSQSGAAYVPLDPTYPAERIAFMLQDAQMPVVLSQAHLGASLRDLMELRSCISTRNGLRLPNTVMTNPDRGATADQVAYLLYTSGSTGHPKGVLGVHRATMNALGLDVANLSLCQ